MSIILGISSKILGAILGVLENSILVFVVLYVLSLPIFSIDELKESKLSDKILKNTPFLSAQINKSIAVVDEFVDMKEKYEAATDSNGFNLEALDLLLKHKVVTIESVETLLEKDKLQIENIDSVLEKYKGE